MRNFLLLILGLFAVCTLEAKEPLRALIVTGQNNHNWQVSHPILRDILQQSGMFTVDLALTPPKGGDMSRFDPEFEKYDVIVMDYNGDRWSSKTDKRFMDYLKRGGGLVLFHAADNAFPDWEEFNRVIALGGWEGRNEKSGSYFYWKDGALVEDSQTKGPGGSHGAQHEYVLTRRNSSHPIVKGLPEEWLHAKDELYDRMRGPGNIKDVLYSASSTTQTGGSGREEVLLFTVDFGNARIFHTMLGHVNTSSADSPAMHCQGFKTTLLRGTQWAATGKVTQRVPADFPSK